MSSDGPAAAGGPTNDQLVLYACAIGRVLPDSKTGELTGELLSDSLAGQSSLPPKKARSHLKAILTKGKSKLTPNKRLRLRNEADQYDVHLLSVSINDDNSYLLVFFVLTVNEFSKYHSISQVFRDFTAQFDASIDSAELVHASFANNRQFQQSLAAVFNRVQLLYGTSPLKSAMTKVDEIKSIMNKNVMHALNSVEHLEDMEETSERFVEQSKQFKSKAVEMKKKQRRSFWLLGALLAVCVLVIILYFAIPAASSLVSDKNDPTDLSSSSTGAR